MGGIEPQGFIPYYIPAFRTDERAIQGGTDV